MSLAVAKTSKLALAKGGKFMLPLLGALGLQPPTNFDALLTDTENDVNFEFTWNPPSSGISPESYIMEFYTLFTGEMEFFITSEEPRNVVIYSIPYGLEWNAVLFSRVETLELTSTPVTLSGITPEPSYP
jgi:hypothetical protein